MGCVHSGWSNVPFTSPDVTSSSLARSLLPVATVHDGAKLTRHLLLLGSALGLEQYLEFSPFAENWGGVGKPVLNQVFVVEFFFIYNVYFMF